MKYPSEAGGTNSDWSAGSAAGERSGPGSRSSSVLSNGPSSPLVFWRGIRLQTALSGLPVNAIQEVPLFGASRQRPACSHVVLHFISVDPQASRSDEYPSFTACILYKFFSKIR